MKVEYLSVAEFAEKVGLTKQAIYKRLTTSLKPFVKEVDGRKSISEEALALFEVKQVKQPLNNELTNELIELLRDELMQKDKQIEKLQELLEHEQELRYYSEQKLLSIEEKKAEEEPKTRKWFWQK